MTKPRTLVVVAHPDDETIFFGGLIAEKSKSNDVIVVCCTDGNSKGLGKQRQEEFRKACETLGATEAHVLAFEDLFDRRLDVTKIQDQLQQFSADEVFTHGPLGEYGHMHHQDVSYAVHRYFHAKKTPVYGIAYQAFPDVHVLLEKEMFRRKSELMTKTYFEETKFFLNVLPVHAWEGFVRIEQAEIEALYEHFAFAARLEKEALRVFTHLHRYLDERWLEKATTRFFSNYFDQLS